MTLHGPIPWSEEVFRATADCRYGKDSHFVIADKIRDGIAQVWRTENGWLVTEVFPDLLFVWCYQGRHFLQLSRELARIAIDNGLRQLGWFTFHTGALRLFREVRGIIYPCETGELEFRLNCEDLCALPKSLIVESRRGQSADTPQRRVSSQRALPRLIRLRQRAESLRDGSPILTGGGTS